MYKFVHYIESLETCWKLRESHYDEFYLNYLQSAAGKTF